MNWRKFDLFILWLAICFGLFIILLGHAMIYRPDLVYPKDELGYYIPPSNLSSPIIEKEIRLTPLARAVEGSIFMSLGFLISVSCFIGLVDMIKKKAHTLRSVDQP